VISLKPAEHRALAQYIHSISAIALDPSKAYLIESRLGPILPEVGCSSFGELLLRAQSEPAGSIRRKIIDAITTGETLFFRDTAPFELLRNKILPDIFDRRSRGASRLPIRIWSAACSSGQEIYTIAMVVKELLGDKQRFDVRLLGTDISDEAVAKASRGVYSQLEVSRGLQDAMLQKYFRRVADGWQVRDDLRALAAFKTLNLMQDFSTLGRFDVILCRNVAIYFGDQDRASLFNRLERALDPGGCLLIGAMESINSIAPQYEAKRHLRAVYYQSKSAPGFEVRR
jgi:chemotaxis protein methyltransferase CheR